MKIQESIRYEMFVVNPINRNVLTDLDLMEDNVIKRAYAGSLFGAAAYALFQSYLKTPWESQCHTALWSLSDR